MDGVRGWNPLLETLLSRSQPKHSKAQHTAIEQKENGIPLTCSEAVPWMAKIHEPLHCTGF
jgi:hypothetical protein